MSSATFRKRTLLPCLSLALLTVVSSLASAQILEWEPEQKAWYSAYSDDIIMHSRSYENLEKSANRGDALAAVYLGFSCLDGGLPKGKKCASKYPYTPDIALANLWLQKAASMGYSDGVGEARIGHKYIGVDNEQALFWLKRSAGHGNAIGMRELASFSKEHKTTTTGADESIAMYLKAAQNGDFGAQMTIGDAYLKGDGVPKDPGQADFWFSKADANVSSVITNSSSTYEEQISDSYFAAGDVAKGLYYLLRAAQMPAYYDAKLQMSYNQGKQSAYQKLGEIYQAGILVPQNLQYAQACFDAKQQLADQQNALQAQFDADLRANVQRNREANSAIISGALSNLSQSIQSLNTPSTIQTTANTQLSNIAAEQQRAQQPQAQKAQLDAQTQQVAKAQPPAPARPAYSSAPASNPQPPAASTYTNINTLCPASGFVPGVMTHPAPDVSLGVPCTPGSVIYANGVPQFNTAGTSLAGTSTGNNNPNSNRPDGPSEVACIDQSHDTTGHPVFYNHCSFPVRYYWTPLSPAPGDYKAFNGDLDPGATNTGAVAIGEYRLYACQEGYLVVDPDGRVISQTVSGFRCVKP